jgi:hypothetical protein
MVGLSRSIFLEHPFSIVPASLVALASTFLQGFGIEKIGRLWQATPQKLVSLVLLGTHKNTGLALTLFDDRTALPAMVSTIFMIFYFIWLNARSTILRRIKK